MQIKPINGNIVIELDNEAEKIQSGLLVPQVKGDRTEAYMIRGIVREIAVDLPIELAKEYAECLNNTQSEEFIDMVTSARLKVGDKVYVSKWEAQHAVLDGKDIIIVKQKDILGILS